MPFGAVSLKPGVNVELTPTMNEAGYASSSLGRFRNGLFEKLGGWTRFYNFVISGNCRALHAWQDLNTNDYLGIGTTDKLDVHRTSDGIIDLTPQTSLSNVPPDFTTTAGSHVVQIVDSTVQNLTAFDSVLFNTPVSVGGIILSGFYPITAAISATTYQITAADAATSSVSNVGAIPVFNSTSGSNSVSVDLANHGLIVGSVVDFDIPTSVGGLTISGTYTVFSITNANTFVIIANALASSTATVAMNSANAEFLYFITTGPTSVSLGYSSGPYSGGLYSLGSSSGGASGTPITTTDWSLDNWGADLIACPKNGPIYQWDPTSGFTTASAIGSGPAFNTGCFVSIGQRIVVAFGSTQQEDIGIVQDPLLVRWSAVENFNDWTASQTNQAGSYRITNGSRIVGGMATPQQNLIWTDLDLWAMGYIGFPDVFGFNKIGSGCGLASLHAAGALRGNVYWMGTSNFFALTASGVEVIPCTVWDDVFQDINTSALDKVFCWPNTPFNEVWWFFPSTGQTQCDSYAKYNVTEKCWDVGTLSRQAGIDQSELGPPIAAGPSGGGVLIYQHETSPDADGLPLTPTFTTGYFYIGEGQEYSFVDQILPDMIWGTVGGSPNATVNIQINVVNYPGDSPTSFGPYAVTKATRVLNVRLRGRQMSYTVSSDDVGSFWRLGRIRHRYAPDGRSSGASG